MFKLSNKLQDLYDNTEEPMHFLIFGSIASTVMLITLLDYATGALLFLILIFLRAIRIMKHLIEKEKED